MDKEGVLVVVETDEVRRGTLTRIRCEEVSGTLVSITPYEHVGYRVAVEHWSQCSRPPVVSLQSLITRLGECRQLAMLLCNSRDILQILLQLVSESL